MIRLVAILWRWAVHREAYVFLSSFLTLLLGVTGWHVGTALRWAPTTTGVVAVTVAVVLGWTLAAVPIALVRYRDRQSAIALEQLSWLISDPELWEAGEPPLEATPEELDRTSQELILEAQCPGPYLGIMSWNLVYTWLDTARSDFFSDEELTERERDVATVLARYAEDFRNALTSFPGVLFLVLPDASEPAVRGLFHGRAVHHPGLSAEALFRANRRGVGQARELAQERAKRHLETHVLLTPRPLVGRLLLTRSMAYYQPYEPERLGIASPVACVRRLKHPVAFRTLFHSFCGTLALLDHSIPTERLVRRLVQSEL